MHTIGIDVSKRKLHAAYLKDPQREKYRDRALPNDAAGHKQLLRWAQKHSGASIEQLHVVLEPTGVYHEALAEALHRAGACVSLANPAQVRYFAKSRGIETKDDAHDPRVLALYGTERRLRPWQPDPPELKRLKALLSRLEVLEQEIRREENRREQAHVGGHDEVLESIGLVIEALEEEKRRLQQQIDDHIDRHPRLAQDLKLLRSIPGVGEKAAPQLLVLLRTHRFRCASQAAAFLGLVPRRHDSGTTVHRPPRLTKKGDKRLRALLYFPALTAKQRNPDVRALVERLERAGKAPKACIAAAMRKLVHIAFGVLNNQTPFQPQTA